MSQLRDELTYAQRCVSDIEENIVAAGSGDVEADQICDSRGECGLGRFAVARWRVV